MSRAGGQPQAFTRPQPLAEDRVSPCGYSRDSVLPRNEIRISAVATAQSEADRLRAYRERTRDDRLRDARQG